MSEEMEKNILEKVERLSKLATLIRYLIGGASAIFVSVVAVTLWVTSQEFTNIRQDETIFEAKARISEQEVRTRSIELWKEKHDATPRVSSVEVFTMDKRLQRVEDQTASILEQLKAINSKL
jgi:hypothetical protein